MFIFTKPNASQVKDSGLAFLVIVLVAFYFLRQEVLLQTGIVALLVLMIKPGIFRPFAVIWFGLSTVLGEIVSRIILSILYVVIVIPIGMIRQAFHYSRAKQWVLSDSVFHTRNHVITPKDLKYPF